MTSENAPQQAFVWIWLPGETAPVVAGRLSYGNNDLSYIAFCLMMDRTYPHQAITPILNDLQPGT
ncbi:hypothetical protein [Erwinia sp. SLM-02]|uniref:hypothetical protein n=1 Tax=Erwinia sp. SLM-02 TaxID=3020057 RepID=UPI0030806F7C